MPLPRPPSSLAAFDPHLPRFALTTAHIPNPRCKHVDAETIFPKLPVYLRTHHTAWLRNSRVKAAVERARAAAQASPKTHAERAQERVYVSPFRAQRGAMYLNVHLNVHLN